MESHITPSFLFGRVERLAQTDHYNDAAVRQLMRDTLALTCERALEREGLPAGNLFSKVDLVCRQLHLPSREAVAVQRMRHHSGHTEPLAADEWGLDCRSLAVLVSHVTQQPIPSEVMRHIPASLPPPPTPSALRARHLRAVVRSVKDGCVEVEGMDDATLHLCVELSGRQHYLSSLLWPDAQVQLLDLQAEGTPSASSASLRCTATVVLEPDFMIDISALARCFREYGTHPLSFTIHRMMPVANTQAILLGSFASEALDDIINQGKEHQWQSTFVTNFHRRALEYCTCPDLNVRANFREEAQWQTRHIAQAVERLFAPQEGRKVAQRHHALLEPSLLCDQLGLQGRVDLMTTDLQLLVEQKSGGNWNIEVGKPGVHGAMQKEDHYVQVLLYHEALTRNFGLAYNSIDAHLLYSHFAADKGLVHAAYFKGLVLQALDLRNQIVATEYAVARDGFAVLLPQLHPETVNVEQLDTRFWQQYLRPQLAATTEVLHALDALTQAYVCQMLTFSYREQLAARLGVRQGQGSAAADLWTMPLEQKRDTGNIYLGLAIERRERSTVHSGYDRLVLRVPPQGEEFLPNFRMGDGVFLYAYLEGETPDARRALLFSGALVDIRSHQLIVQLKDGQQNPDIFEESGRRGRTTARKVLWCVEHSGTDGGTTAALRSLWQLAHDATGQRQLLLAQREPQANTALQLTRSYSPSYDEVVLRAKQAQDYFLLIGPPGTGKTSQALQFMVRETLASTPAEEGDVLLMAYTNRAVDEICDMLTEAGLDFLRVGQTYSCAPQHRSHLMEERLEPLGKLTEVKDHLRAARIVVGTTSTLQNRTYLFNLKRFACIMVDEASQILEPQLVGLLTRAPKFILLGDHKQLPAVVQQRPQDSVVTQPELLAMGLTDCRDSLFERLLRRERRLGRSQFVGTLRLQGRMHPEVAAFSASRFYAAEHLSAVPLPHQSATRLPYTLPPLDALEEALCRHRVLFVPSPQQQGDELSDKVNAFEARLVAQVVQRVRRQLGDAFSAERSVGVIVPYRNQIAMVRQELERLGDPSLLAITVDTVERYQGSQRDVIIYSFTIRQAYQLDFLAANTFEEDGQVIDRKLNVALTRARLQMVLTGCEPVLRENAVFAQLLDFVKERGGHFIPPSMKRENC